MIKHIQILMLVVILASCQTVPTATLYNVNYTTMNGISNNITFVSYSCFDGNIVGKTVDYKEVTINNASINSVEKTTVVKNY